jgi:pyruvate/2-oxoglutarate dehydrogenase complex dihydrolipoamide acyltransferase (E2) component
MIAIEDNVEQLCTVRAKQAMADYKAGIADEGRGRQRSIQAIIAYGHALQEGRKDRSNQAFAKWVSDNGLDVGSPWDEVRERSEAMKIGSVFRTVTEDAFAACPYTTPSNIMKWYRKAHAPTPAPDAEKPQKAKQRDKALEAIKAMEAAGQPVTENGVAALAGVGAGTANKAISIHRTVATVAKDIEAKTIAAASEEQRFASLSDKSKLKLADAIRIHKERLSKQFEQAVNTEVRKRIDTADDHVRKSNKEMSARLLLFEMERGKKGIFTPLEYKQLLMCVHPDNTASIDIRNRITDIIVKHEARLVRVTP